MMSRKTLGGLLGVLVAVGLLSLLTGRARYSTAEGGGFVDILPEFDPAQAQTVKAWLGAFPDQPVELARRGEGWAVTSRWDWTAKEDLVKRLLDDLDGLRGEKRADSQEVLADFQADDSLGLHVVASGTGGSELFHLVVGKSSVRGGGFLRRAGSDEVFLTQAPLRSSFGVYGEEPKAPDAKRWIELRVHQADKQDVDRLVIHGDEEIVLEKEFQLVEAAPEPAASDTAAADGAAAPEPAASDTAAGDVAAAGIPPAGGDTASAVAPQPAGADAAAAGPPEMVPDRTEWTWKADSRGEFDKGKADNILTQLCSLYAFDVADPESLAAYGLEPPSRSIEVFFESGDTLTVHFGNDSEDGKRMYFRIAPDGKPAEIYKSTADRFFPKREDLKPKA
jgi:hypothetical protein